MWERTLQDLIRGLRANKQDENKFIAKAIEEIRAEIRTDDMHLKAGAILKLTYLEMLGYDMAWAAFHVVEVMSSPKFHLKSLGYLAAVQSFNKDTDVLMLTTNLLKKDLTSTPADVAITLNGLSNIMSSELARDLSPELIRMLNHSRPSIRKKAIVATYKALAEYPDAWDSAMTRLREKLDDPDPGVVAATINVLVELARIRPESCLILAPQLFHLLTTSSNNWMLIKIVKLFGMLSPHEPRLVKKLQSPITDLISTTSAISLLYECVHTCIIGGMLEGSAGSHLAKTCVSKLASFIEDSDPNLKYIALLAMVKIVPSHPHLIADYQDMIMSSLSDQDISIRMRALDLVSAMVDQNNLQSIVQQILSHLVQDSSSSPMPSAAELLTAQASALNAGTSSIIPPNHNPAYRLVLCRSILDIGSKNTYENVVNFEWYLSVLVDLAHVANVDVGDEIRNQLVDLVGSMGLMHGILNDESWMVRANEPGSCSEVLWAAAWICGEYSTETTDQSRLIPCLVHPGIARLSPTIIAVYLQSMTKVFGSWTANLANQWGDDELVQVQELVPNIISRLETFTGSADIEVQERAANVLQLFNFIQADLSTFKPRPKPQYDSPFADVSSDPDFPKSLYLIKPLVSYELNPVAQSAQQSVPIPFGLDLDSWIVPPPIEPPKERSKVKKSKKGKGVHGQEKAKKSKRKNDGEVDEVEGENYEELNTAEEIAERQRQKAERQERLRDDPYYIVDDRPPLPPVDDIDSIPVVKLEGMPALNLASAPQRTFHIDRVGEMPQRATSLAHPSPSIPSSRSHTPSLPPPTGSAFAFTQYEGADDDTTRTSTPEPIKVTRTKKKKGPGRKKLTENTDDGVA
ncbi:Adaptor protein complex AP-3 delta subunit [Flagelloscypha sp. PMI_526]|nr:Adaptor protein complex AP-3 delta subunit [Flagelloscypha sp. PMI_526]